MSFGSSRASGAGRWSGRETSPGRRAARPAGTRLGGCWTRWCCHMRAPAATSRWWPLPPPRRSPMHGPPLRPIGRRPGPLRRRPSSSAPTGAGCCGWSRPHFSRCRCALARVRIRTIASVSTSRDIVCASSSIFEAKQRWCATRTVHVRIRFHRIFVDDHIP